MWMLVEWQTEKPTSTYDVVRLSSVICEQNEVQEGKIVFVLTKNDYSAMRARVLMISDDKRTLRKEKEILEKRELELKTIVSTCMQSIRRLDLQRPHSSTADLKAGLPACASKYGEPKKESDASSSSSVSSSSSFDQNHLHNILMTNRDSICSGADRLVRERREIRNRHKHRRRHYKPTLSQPRTCSTPLLLSTLPQVSPPVPHLISPLVPPPVMHQVAPVLQSVPPLSVPRPMCADQGTQTEVPYPKPTDDYIKQMKSLVGELMERQRTMIARFFETVIKGSKHESMFKHLCDEKKNADSYLVNGHEEYNGEYEESEDYEENGDNVANNENCVNGVNCHNEGNGEHEVNGDDNRMDWINGDSSVNIMDNSYISSESSRKLDTHFSMNDSGDDMIPIGNGYAEVPRRLLRDMNWAAYSTATRQLLHAIFPRKVLATHSLTGRPSPAFADKPAKQRLNQNIVSDIVKTVTKYCKNVTNSMVRSVITITCTDEAKLFRNRQKFKKQRQSQRRSKDTASISTSEQSLASHKSNIISKNSHNSKKNMSPRSDQYISSDNAVVNASTGNSRPEFDSWSQLLETSSE